MTNADRVGPPDRGKNGNSIQALKRLATIARRAGRKLNVALPGNWAARPSTMWRPLAARYASTGGHSGVVVMEDCIAMSHLTEPHRSPDLATPIDLRGARVAFTGRLASMTRRAAWERVQIAGGMPCAAVTRRTTHLVVGGVGWPLASDGAVSRPLKTAQQLNAEGARIAIVAEGEFLAALGVAPAMPAEAKAYPIESACALLGVPREALARWERCGLVRAAGGRYDFQDLVSIRAVAELVQQGARPEAIARSLRGLAALLPDTQRPLAQLNLVLENPHTLLVELGDARIAPNGQLTLNFDALGPTALAAQPPGPAEQAPVQPPRFLAQPRRVELLPPSAAPGMSNAARALSTRREARPVVAAPQALQAPQRDGPDILGRLDRGDESFSASQWFERGRMLEERERFEPAADAYRAALALEPRFVEAGFNLGNVLRAQGRIDAAAEVFRLVTRLDAQFAEAWYNLADAEEECGRLASAILALESAVRADPQYADAHFNLARCYDLADRRREARAHWVAYLRLDPQSRWSRMARERLNTEPRP
ncbi:MAG: tetratricopeptide repeat protein [Phycisphaerae bacterium]